MPDRDLVDLLGEHRDLVGRRRETDPGTPERAAVDEELQTVQHEIRFWSDETPDETPDRPKT